MDPELQVIGGELHDNDPNHTRKGQIIHRNYVEDVVVQEGTDIVFRINHPNWLSFRGEFTLNGTTFQAYEPYLCNLKEFKAKCEARALDYKLFEDEGTAHPSKTVIKIFQDILTGLNGLRSYGRMNEDILTMENIFIVEYSNGRKSKVMAKFMGLKESKNDDIKGTKELMMKGMEQLILGFFDPSVYVEANDLIERFGGENSHSQAMATWAFTTDWCLILRHPLFYGKEKASKFIKRYSDFLGEVRAGEFYKAFLSKLEELNPNYLGDNGKGWKSWDYMFSVDLRIECENSRKKGSLDEVKFYTDCRCLVRFYRNMLCHYIGVINAKKSIFGKTDIGSVIKLMRERHPMLIVQIYKVYESFLQKFTKPKIPDDSYLGCHFVGISTINYEEYDN